MSNRVRSLRPPYPVYDPTPIFGGRLPDIEEIGAPDMRPSALNPHYSLYAGAHGRNFAGLGDSSMQTADIGIKDYPNELNLLAEADDVQGNGVFDPHGSHGNLHPDQGVFEDHEGLPGYLVRERFYAPSEVTDATTGNQVMYVPGGAVAIDQSQLDTVRARQQLWEIPPGVSPRPVTTPDFASSWIPGEYSTSISGLGVDAAPVAEKDPRSAVPTLAALLIGGVAVGIFAATLMKPKRGRG